MTTATATATATANDIESATIAVKAKSAAYLKGLETRKLNELTKKWSHIDLYDAANYRMSVLNIAIQNGIKKEGQITELDSFKYWLNGKSDNGQSDVIFKQALKTLVDTDFDRVQNVIKTIDENTLKGIEQTKVVQKIGRLLFAIGTDTTKDLCQYLRTAIVTSLKCNGNATFKTLISAMSRAVYRDNMSSMKLREGFENLNGFSPTTGSSQVSQCRMVFNILGFYVEGTFVKGGNDNNAVLNEYGQHVLTKLMFKQV